MAHRTVIINPGDRFGRLVIVNEDKPRKISKNRHVRQFLCKCDCGNSKTVRMDHLRSGKTKSCGCLAIDQTRLRMKTHGKTKTTEYKIWRGIIDRCLYQSHKFYHRYGGRGIIICDEWMKFENFLSDMGPRPNDNCEIERVDNDVGYCKSNCVWATHEDQSNNKSNNIRIEMLGRNMTLKQWSRHAGINYKIGRKAQAL